LLLESCISQLNVVQLRSSAVSAVQKRQMSIVVGLEAFRHFGEG
jgi:hypothetical protein